MRKTQKLPRFDQFKLSHLFILLTGIAVLLAIIRVLTQANILHLSAVLLAAVSILGAIAFLIGDHELKIENGTRTQLGKSSMLLVFLLAGLSAVFMWLVRSGLYWIR